MSIKSIWHVQANTPEDLRQQLILDLQQRKKIFEYPKAKNNIQHHANFVRDRIFDELIDFWTDITIDPIEEDQTDAPAP